jgi:serine/threonine protein kinase HipA of HipAB toxin-antitoxin module
MLSHSVSEFALALNTLLLALSRFDVMYFPAHFRRSLAQGASQHSSTPEEAFMPCARGDLTPTKHMSRKCALGWSPLTHHLYGVRGRFDRLYLSFGKPSSAFCK